MAIRALQYRLYPTQPQEQARQVQLDVSRPVDNLAWEERQLAGELAGKSSGQREGDLLAKQYKKTCPQSKLVPSHVLQVAMED